MSSLAGHMYIFFNLSGERIHVFPNAELSDFFYHLSQCIYRIICHSVFTAKYEQADVHLKNSYVADQLLIKVRMVAAIAFVPEADVRAVVHAFEALYQIVPIEIEPLLEYFEDKLFGPTI